MGHQCEVGAGTWWGAGFLKAPGDGGRFTVLFWPWPGVVVTIKAKDTPSSLTGGMGGFGVCPCFVGRLYSSELEENR